MALGLIMIAPFNLQAAKPKAKAKKPAKAKAKAGPTPAEMLQNAETAFKEYRFDDALQLLDEYEEKEEPTAASDELRRRADLGSTMLRRVEKIAIIDSLTVDSADFVNAFRLSEPTGALASPAVLPEGFQALDPSTVYQTEDRQRMIWSQPDAEGRGRLVESSMLVDGTWELPHSLGESLALSDDSDSNFPFLTSDGTTLYFAATGDQSLGGYDIFISRNDGDDYLAPQNMGMPYNSPYNDFLLAIDDLTGCGWWVTDRNHIPGKMTVYVFIPQELRVSYPAEDPATRDRGFVTDIRSTQTPGADYSRILNFIHSDKPAQTDNHGDTAFDFALPDGRILHRLSDFSNPKAAELMEHYLDKVDELHELISRLRQLRREYANGQTADSDEIRSLELQEHQLQTQLLRISNSVVEAELKNL